MHDFNWDTTSGGTPAVLNRASSSACSGDVMNTCEIRARTRVSICHQTVDMRAAAFSPATPDVAMARLGRNLSFACKCSAACAHGSALKLPLSFANASTRRSL